MTKEWRVRPVHVGLSSVLSSVISSALVALCGVPGSRGLSDKVEEIRLAVARIEVRDEGRTELKREVTRQGDELREHSRALEHALTLLDELRRPAEGRKQ